MHVQVANMCVHHHSSRYEGLLEVGCMTVRKAGGVIMSEGTVHTESGIGELTWPSCAWCEVESKVEGMAGRERKGIIY